MFASMLLTLSMPRSTCFMPYVMLSMLRSSLSHVFPHASMSHTMCLCLDLFFPCVVWLDPHVSMLFTCLFFFPTCFVIYAVFSYVLFLFLLYVDVRVTCSHACMMSLAMPCLDLCVLCVYFHVIV